MTSESAASEPESTPPAEPESASPAEPESASPVEPDSDSPAEADSDSPSQPESASSAESESTSPVEPESASSVEPESASSVGASAPVSAAAPASAPAGDSRAKTLATYLSLPLIALVCFFVVSDRVAAGARLVHAVNATAVDATLSVGELSIAAPAGSVTAFELPEGRHQARLEQAGRPSQSVILDVQGSFTERLADRTAFVVNVGGAGLLLWEQEEYGDVPAASRLPDRLIFGEPFVTVPGVDFRFQPFPEKIDATGGTLVRSRLSVYRGPPVQALERFPEDSSQGLDYAELHLDPVALDEDLLGVYVRRARIQGALQRVVAFLTAGLEPISVPWHRVYQDLIRASGEQGALAVRKQYAELLEASPKNADLLYLNGRLEPDPAVGEERYRAAVAARPDHGFANYALAVRAFRRGDHAAALPHVKRAIQERPHDPVIANLAYRVRFVAGEYEALAKELEERRAGEPVDLLLLRHALEVEVARGDVERAKEIAQAFRQAVRGRTQADPQQLVLHSELSLLRLEGKLDALREKLSEIREEPIRQRLLFQVCLQLGDLPAAEAAVGKAAWTREASLLLCLAWTRKADAEKAASWRQRARDLLATGSPAERAAGEFLTRDAVSVDEVTPLALPPATKAALLELLGHREAAKRFDVTLYFPHRFLS